MVSHQRRGNIGGLPPRRGMKVSLNGWGIVSLSGGARKCMHGTRDNTITNPCGNTTTPEAVDGGGTGADG